MDYSHDFREDIILKNVIEEDGIIGINGIFYTKL